MQWLQDYHFLHVGTWCDASKQIFFLSIVCSDCKGTIFFMCMWRRFVRNQNTFCDASKQIFFWSLVCNDWKNTVFHMLEHCVIHQNEFSFEVLYAMIARILFSTCWDLFCMLEHCVMHQKNLFKYCMQWLQYIILEVRAAMRLSF